MKPSGIIVVGSSNTDMVVQSSHLPGPGETVLGKQFSMLSGGKGANQAVAAARLGGVVTFIGKVGEDIFGQEAKNNLAMDGINIDHVSVAPSSASGVALIMVDENGENCISVALGANEKLDPSDILKASEVINTAGYLLVQLEVPLATVKFVVDIAYEAGLSIILNPAPAQLLSNELLHKLSIITPNESEAELLTGIKVFDESSARQAAKYLKDRGIDTVIITLGPAGSFVLSDDLDTVIPTPTVNAVDTTAAGDTFNGALTVGLSEGMTLKDAIIFANKAAAMSVTKLGAQSSIPTRIDLEQK